MLWMEAVGEAIRYIEEHITDEISPEVIAKQVNLSPFYFQKGFLLGNISVTGDLPLPERTLPPEMKR